MSSSDSHTNLRRKSEPSSGSSNQFSNEDIKDILRSWLLENERTLLAQKNVGEFNGVMMQWFHWYTDDDGNHWKKLKEEAANLARAGITALWLPPAYKGMNGAKDVGYATYDLFDLGEFDQKGSISLLMNKHWNKLSPKLLIYFPPLHLSLKEKLYFFSVKMKLIFVSSLKGRFYLYVSQMGQFLSILILSWKIIH